MDDGKISMAVLLDLSAAFDTIDHEILLARLQSYFGVDGTALAWSRSYITGRIQFVSVLGHDHSVSLKGLFSAQSCLSCTLNPFLI